MNTAPSTVDSSTAAEQARDATDDPDLKAENWWLRYRVSRKITYTILALALLSGSATVLSATGGGFGLLRADPTLVKWLLLADAILLLMLSVVVILRFIQVGNEWIRGRAGSRLHTRMILIFSTVAVTPAVLVALFATFFLHFGMQSWLSGRVQSIVYQSDKVVRGIFIDRQNGLSREVLSLASALNRLPLQVLSNSTELERYLNIQSLERGLDEVAVLEGSTPRVVAAAFNFIKSGYDDLPKDLLETAQVGDVHILSAEEDSKLRAILLMGRQPDLYLVVGRSMDPLILKHIRDIRQNFGDYQDMERKRGDLEISFVMIFIIATVLLLLAAAALGLVFSNRLMRPISSLIGAADQVGKGDLDARADSGGVDSGKELELLIRSFNDMTQKLKLQRQELLDTNDELDQRRHFIEAVLAGVSAGVIGLDGKSNISVANLAASRLLEMDMQQHLGKPLAEVVPGFEPILEARSRRNGRRDPIEVTVEGKGGKKTLLVNITVEDKGSEIIGYVISFDDVTDLLSAQRKAAWADVARRIAHEIKNPLTPIQLAAERLNRKYLKVIEQDRDTFETCTNTIIRHVGDIGRMVEEFRDFARMPQPIMADANISELCRQCVFLETNRTPQIRFDIEMPDQDVHLSCDARQLGRALTNLLKNAAEAVTAVMDDRSGSEENGEFTGIVKISVRDAGDQLLVVVEDNGRGFPKEHLHQLTEPYVTTREKGTGLGLAIVKKIVEDHGGELMLGESGLGGALVEIILFKAPGTQSEPKEHAAEIG